MNSPSLLTELLQRLVWFAPLIICFLVGALLAIAKRRTAPDGWAFLLAGCILGIVTQLGTLIGLSTHALNCIVFVLMIMGIFRGRRKAPRVPAPVPPTDENPPPTRVTGGIS